MRAMSLRLGSQLERLRHGLPVHAAGRFADQQNRQEALWIGVATKQQDPGLGSIGHSSRVGSAAGPAIAGLRRARVLFPREVLAERIEYTRVADHATEAFHEMVEHRAERRVDWVGNGGNDYVQCVAVGEVKRLGRRGFLR